MRPCADVRLRAHAPIPHGPVRDDGHLHVLGVVHDLLDQAFAEPRAERAVALPGDENLRDPLLAGELRQGLGDVHSLENVRLDLQAFGKGEMSLEVVAIFVAQMGKIGRFQSTRPDSRRADSRRRGGRAD